MSLIDVRNVKWSAERTAPPGYDNWLDFWQKMKGRKAVKCAVLLCTGAPVVGAPVARVGEGSKEYILPLCDICSGKNESQILNASEGDLVSVEEDLTVSGTRTVV